MIAIRPTRPEDAAAIADCVDRVARERRHLAVTQGFTLEATKRYLESLTQNGGIHLSATDGGRVIGWCDVMPGSIEGLTHCGRLGMGLLSEYRGQGTGKRLVAAVIQAAREKGLEKIELEVFASNAAAIRLYESAGFGREGRKTNARKLAGQYDDLLLYGLALAPAP
jgi:ribosomal protein S18 acetylase RimI-like enzyme